MSNETPAYETPEAGALWGLYYALFHAKDWPWWKDAPPAVIDAYSAVQHLRTPQGGQR